MPAPLLAALEGNHGGDSPNPEAGRGERVCFGVELEDQRLTGTLVSQLIERGCHHLAWPAPVGVEVDENRNAGVADRTVEFLVGHLLGAIETDRLSALGALGAGREPVQIHPVRSRAEGALHDYRTGCISR